MLPIRLIQNFIFLPGKTKRQKTKVKRQKFIKSTLSKRELAPPLGGLVGQKKKKHVTSNNFINNNI